MWDDPGIRTVQVELLERLFDRVNAYRSASEFRDDATLREQRRWMPTELMHKRGLDWEVLKHAYSNPVPGRGPYQKA